MTRMHHLVSLVCNAATAALVVYAFVGMAFGSVGELSFQGTQTLRLFTVDSNLLAAASCLCLIPSNVRGLRAHGDDRVGLSRGLLLFKFVGTAAVSVTFLTVVFFLGPTVGFGAMLSGPNLWLHLVCPVLCIASFCLAETGRITIPQSLLGLIPVVLYGAWYLVMVVIIGADNGGWTDWYGFNRGGMWPVSIVAMTAATLVICLLLRLPHRR